MTFGLRALLEATVWPGWRCLDLGCGDGRTAGPWLRERGCFYTGVDVSANAVSMARHLGLDAMVVRDVSSLPVRDATFDAVICGEVLEHLFQPQRAVAEPFRVLRPGGTFIATVPNVACWRRRIGLALLGRWNRLGDDLAVERPWRDPHIRFFNPGALRSLLGYNGFKRVGA